jgi:hypothetical protein
MPRSGWRPKYHGGKSSDDSQALPVPGRHENHQAVYLAALDPLQFFDQQAMQRRKIKSPVHQRGEARKIATRQLYGPLGRLACWFKLSPFLPI